MAEVGKIERVPLREIWPHEEADFTPWLQGHLDVLEEVLHIGLTNAEREQAAGDFAVDLRAEDGEGHPVVIENQLEKSDHDHLGKLITYATAFDASVAVWIVSEPRPEHVSAVSWLNQVSTDTSFYLLKLEALRIGGSTPAPLLTVITGPTPEARQIGSTKRELAERHLIRKSFWTGLLQTANRRTNLHGSISPGVENWISAGAGRSGLSFAYVIRQHDARVELYIDTGDEATSRAIFEQLLAAKDQVESGFGGALEWQPLENRRACRIRKLVEVGGWKDEEKWPQLQEAMVDAMVRLEKALRPHIATL